MNLPLVPGRQPYTGHTRSMNPPVSARSCPLQNPGKTQAKLPPVCDQDSSLLKTQEQEKLLHQQALTKAQQGNYGEAIALITQLIHRNPSSASHYNNRGLLHFQNGQLEAALADYDQALQLNPRLAKIYNNRANCYAALGYLVEAIADYDVAIDLDPTNIRAWINQGITFRDLEMYSQAVENFDLALRFTEILHNPSQTSNSTLEGHIYAERGRTYHLSGDWNCAVADYRRALTVLPQTRLLPQGTSFRLRTQVQNWLNNLLEPLG